MRLKLVISYDGAPYAGWQSQADRDAVQDALETAFEKVAGSRVVLHGAGRTDAGVHALAQCAHAEVADGPLEPSDWLRAVNANLPVSIRVMDASRVADDFHARFSATGKIYRYLIRNAEVLPPLEVDRAWHVPKPLDEDMLGQAAQIFVGRHDFAAFSANRGGVVRDTHRTIRDISLVREGTLLTLTFEGEGFLYKMVRMLTAATVRAAQHRESLDALRSRLKKGPRWNHVAPAGGLYLVKVLY